MLLLAPFGRSAAIKLLKVTFAVLTKIANLVKALKMAKVSKNSNEMAKWPFEIGNFDGNAAIYGY